MTRHDLVSRLVRQEVLAPAGQMIQQLQEEATTALAEDRTPLVDLDELTDCCFAPDYSEAPDGYRIGQAFNGSWFWEAEHAKEGGFGNAREAILEAWNDCGEEPPSIEAATWFIVSERLAEHLEAIGALVARDVFGLCIWGRTDGGTALEDNGDLWAVAQVIHRAAA